MVAVGDSPAGMTALSPTACTVTVVVQVLAASAGPGGLEAAIKPAVAAAGSSVPSCR